MKENKKIFSTCLFVILFTVSMLAQKKVAVIEKMYQKEGFYLTINKINKLKPKYQSLRNVQLMLADSYWQIGDKGRAVQVYQRVANNFTIPNDFQDKYAKAINSEKEKENSDSEVIATKEQMVTPLAVYASKKVPSKVEPEKGDNMEEKYLARTSLEPISPEKNISISSAEHKCIQVSPAKIKTNTSSILTFNEVEDRENLYRIRVGAFPSMEEVRRSDFEHFGEIDVKEWANKKIVFVGYFNSVETAKGLIDSYLKTAYKNAVVVKKDQGRYRKITL